MSRNIAALTASARQRRENAERAVQQALREARKTSGPVTVAGLAAAAGVSTDFIYRHPELRPQVETLRRARTSQPGRDPASDPDAAAAASTLVRRLSQQLADERRRRREEVAELRHALETAHGELLTLRRQLNGQGQALLGDRGRRHRTGDDTWGCDLISAASGVAPGLPVFRSHSGA